MTDSEIRKAVIAQLEFDPSVEANNIGVAVEHGVVTLTGHVGNYAQRVVAEQVTRRVSGVRGVAQELKVRPHNDAHTDDDQLAQRALQLLDLNAELPRDAITVTVQNGWLTLNGHVDWQYQRGSAEAAVKRLAGLAGVTNMMSISPQVVVGDVQSRILDALRRNAETESTGIKVIVDNDQVTLEGKIKAWNERAIAERAAWSVCGVRRVVDRLTLG